MINIHPLSRDGIYPQSLRFQPKDAPLRHDGLPLNNFIQHISFQIAFVWNGHKELSLIEPYVCLVILFIFKFL